MSLFRAIQRRRSHPVVPLPMPALHRFVFAGQPQLQEGEPGPKPDPDMDDPEIARQVRRAQNKALLLQMIPGEIAAREQRNVSRNASLVQLRAAMQELENQVLQSGVDRTVRRGLPHQIAYQFAHHLLDYVLTGNEEPLETAFENMQIENARREAFAELRDRLLSAMARVRADAQGRRRFARELSISDSVKSAARHNGGARLDSLWRAPKPTGFANSATKLY